MPPPMPVPPAPPLALLLMMLLEATFSVPCVENVPAAAATAELPLTVQLVSVVVPREALLQAAAVAVAELPLTVQLVSVVVPT